MMTSSVVVFMVVIVKFSELTMDVYRYYWMKTFGYLAVLCCRFDIFGFTPDSPQDEAGIKRSSEYLESLIKEEVDAGIASERVIIGGFSQGGAIALCTALNSKRKLAGVLALSSWLPMHAHFISRGNAQLVNRDVPILQCHGKADQLLPFLIGHLTSQILKAQIGLTQAEFKVRSYSTWRCWTL